MGTHLSPLGNQWLARRWIAADCCKGVLNGDPFGGKVRLKDLQPIVLNLQGWTEDRWLEDQMSFQIYLLEHLHMDIPAETGCKLRMAAGAVLGP